MKLLRSFLILTLVVLLSACNTATKVTKVQKWRNDFNNWFFAGYYDVQTLKAEKGNVEIPYEAELKKVRFYCKSQKMIRSFMKKKSLLKRRFAFF